MGELKLLILEYMEINVPLDIWNGYVWMKQISRIYGVNEKTISDLMRVYLYPTSGYIPPDFFKFKLLRFKPIFGCEQLITMHHPI